MSGCRTSSRRDRWSIRHWERPLASVAFVLVLAGAEPSIAQSPGGGEEQSSEEKSTLDLPLIGEIELPSWLSFLGSSSEDSGSSQSAQGAGGGAGAGQGQQGTQRPPAVVVTEATVQSVGDEFEFLGSIEAIENVTLQPRVNGFIEEVFFQGGDVVTVGERLFKIEDAQYEASLNSAQAQLAGAQAQLAQARRSFARAQELIDSGTIPQAELDNARATFESAEAQQLQAEAQVRQAQLNLDYTSIEAPIDGVISEPIITKGNYVSAASGTLAEIVQLDPIWGTFPIAESQLAEWRRVGSEAASQEQDVEEVDDYRLSLRLPNDEAYRDEGAFAFVGNTVDPSTGTVEVRIRFPNPDGRLLPNENVRLVASEREPPRLPVIPMAAIQLSREGRSVFVLNAQDNTVRRQPVQMGKQMRGSVAIQSGVEEGDLVVVQGLQNIQDGAKVSPNRETANPEPSGSMGGGEDGGDTGANAPEGQASTGGRNEQSASAEGEGAGSGADGSAQ